MFGQSGKVDNLVSSICTGRSQAGVGARSKALSVLCLAVFGLSPSCPGAIAQVIPDIGQTGLSDYSAADRDRDLLDDSAIVALRADLKSKDDAVRQSALRRLNDLGANAWLFVPELITIIDGVSDDDKQMALDIARRRCYQ